MSDDITDTDDERMYWDGYVGEEPDYYNEEYVGDDYNDTPVRKTIPVSRMAQNPMAVKIHVNRAADFPAERYLFVPDGRCVLNIEAWPHVLVKNDTVSTMRISAQDTLYYFPDCDDQQGYMNQQGIVVKKEDMLRDSRPSRNLDDDDIPF